MSTYAYRISDAHKEKLQRLADQNGVSVESALDGIVCYLKASKNFSRPKHLKVFITDAEIEDVIDRIFV